MNSNVLFTFFCYQDLIYQFYHPICNRYLMSKHARLLTLVHLQREPQASLSPRFFFFALIPDVRRDNSSGVCVSISCD